jgi:2-iminobutanoate/2-iminopropanoate deaminase
MPKQVFNPPELPPAIGPYSWATRHGQLIFLAGTAAIGTDGKLVGGSDIRAQTRATLENLKIAVTAAGGTMADIVKTTVYLADVSDYAGMNDVYRSYFPEGPPARATLVTGFVVPGLLVEIEAIAALD